MGVADRRCSITEEDDRDPVLTPVFGGECCSCSYGQVTADDPVAAEHVVRRIEEVHRAAETLRTTRDLAEELGHRGAGRHASREGEAVVPVGGEDVVLRAQCSDGVDCDWFLVDVQVEKPSDLALGVGAGGFFFEATDEPHLAIELEMELRRSCEITHGWFEAQRGSTRGD